MQSKDKNAALQKWLSRKKKPATGIPKLPKGTPAALSHGQQRLWLLQQLYPENSFYHYGHLYKFRGDLDVEILKESFQKVAERQESLKINFEKTETGVFQKVNSELQIPIDFIDLQNIPKAQFETEFEQIKTQKIQQPFDLSQDALLRISILKTCPTPGRIDQNEYWVILVMHHIIGDRWSLEVLNKELAQTYQALKKGENPTFSSLEIQYSDFANWQKNQPENQKDLNYWKEKLAGELPILNLPKDFSPPSNSSFKGITASQKLSPTLSKKLKEFCNTENVTMYVLMLSIFKILLYRYSNQTDILVGSPFTNRDKTALEKLIGFFNETLVLRSDFSQNLTFSEILNQIKQTTLEAFSHKNTPFETLVRELKPERHGTSNPLFQTMFLFNTLMKTPSFGEDLEVEESVLDIGAAKFDLTLFVTDKGDFLTTDFEFATDLFELETIERMQGHFRVLAENIIENPSKRVSEFGILTEEERKVILGEFARELPPVPLKEEPTNLALSDEVLSNRSPFRRTGGILDLFQKHTNQTPNQTAVIYENESLTYAELNNQSNIIAQKLQNIGIQSNTPVGLYTNRSVNMLVGILGILKSGGAYLPLDPEYPADRIEYMLEDAGVSVVLSQKEIIGNLPEFEGEKFGIEDVLSSGEVTVTLEGNRYQGEDLAYIIYTSGSTGKPKGVPITHRNLVHSTAARFSYFEQQPKAFLLLSSFSFDSSVVGIFWTITTGGTLVLPKRRIEQDIENLSNLIAKHRISHTLLLPSLWNLVLEFSTKKMLEALEVVMVAGEACASTLVKKHFATVPKVALVNEYGPTEGTVWCTAHHIKLEDSQTSVPIGRPIPFMENYILNESLQPVPIGVAGELFIGGAGVATGYLNRPKLTAERFLNHPFSDNSEAKIYKTGDLVRFRKNGLIDFLGRADHQIKIRGHRVELDEIKERLLRHSAVQDAVVIAKKEGDLQRLFAYLILENKEVIDFRNYLKERLPDYMIPAAFIELKEFPRLPNGKVNLKALPTPQQNDFNQNNTFEAPKTETEKLLADIWLHILKLEKVSINDNFFDIGGDSILSISLIANAKKAGFEIAPNHLFEHQTIKNLAQFLDKKAAGEIDKPDFSSMVALRSNGTKNPLFCIHSGGGHIFFYQPLTKYLDGKIPVFALQPSGIDGKETRHNSIESMAKYYLSELQKLQPEGPYTLLGTCFSNAVVLEIAHLLKQQNEEVENLIIVDSGPAHLTGAKIRGERKTAARFAAMLKKGDWKAIQKKIKHRGIYLRQKLMAPFENEQDRNLRETISNLNQLYKNYNWKPFSGKITFIRSSEFANRKDKDYHIQQWQHLAKNGVDISVVEGHHVTLFEEPEVQGLAQQLNEVLG